MFSDCEQQQLYTNLAYMREVLMGLKRDDLRYFSRLRHVYNQVVISTLPDLKSGLLIDEEDITILF